MMERWTDLMPNKAEAQEMLRNTMPIGRMGTADEVAVQFSFLLQMTLAYVKDLF